MFLLVLGGCGYKANPYYEEDKAKTDENVKFIIQDQNIKSGK